MFVCGDFNIHHQHWLNYSGGADRSDELFYNFSILNDLTQIVNFPTRIPDCDSHSPALSSDASICSTMPFPPLRILTMFLSQFPLILHHIHNGMLHFIALLMIMIILVHWDSLMII